MQRIKKYPAAAYWGIFLICMAVRIIEYFFIRTDETVLAENVIHKLFGIGLLFVLLRASGSKWNDIGFSKPGFMMRIAQGLLLGAVCFTLTYAIECIILHLAKLDLIVKMIRDKQAETDPA